MKYPFEKHVVICIGGRCNKKDLGDDRGEEIRFELKDLNKQLGNKPTIRVCAVSCLDLCDYGPNMIVWPEGTVYSHLDRESAKRAYLGEIGQGPKAEDKLLRQEELVQEKVKS